MKRKAGRNFELKKIVDKMVEVLGVQLEPLKLIFKLASEYQKAQKRTYYNSKL